MEIPPKTDAAQSLEACDREPIHIPGSIQPHGLLLVADADGGAILGAAGDVGGRLGLSWTGRSLGEMLQQNVQAALSASPDSITLPLDQVLGPSELFDVVAHRSGDLVLVEMEPASAHTISAAAALFAVEASNRAFERVADLRGLCERAATAFRRLTGFDRVMVYRFLDDGAGVVLAEDRAPGLSTFMNHHFPASDIPKQARALYVRNRVRVIPDVAYAPAPILSGPSLLEDVDLSDVALRSVSPIHIQYLKNMGVAASASVSIVRDGLLWGLIACHNATPRYLPFDVRLACDVLAGGLARQIRSLDEAEHYRERIRLRSLEDAVSAKLGEASLAEFVASTGEELCAMLAADGFAAVQGADLCLAGRCPDEAAVRQIADWAHSRALAHPFSTHQLALKMPAAAAFQERASGVLAATMSTEQATMLLWFRAEQVETVNWAGNPHKGTTADPDAQLTPRSSFEAWSQAIRGQARPWTPLEVESAQRLVRTIFDARQNRRVRDLNRDLTATAADNQQLLLQKDFLLKEVSHRTQNSLQLVSSFLAMQARAVGDEALSGHLAEAQRRVSAVALVHRRLYSDSRVDTVDLSRYLEDLCGEIRASMDDPASERLTLNLAPIVVSADNAVRIGLVLTELIINANKYAYGGAPGPVSVSLEQHHNRLRLIVADQGSGRTGTRQGFGSRMLEAMVKGLAGDMQEGDNEPGLRVIVTAPIV